MCGTAPPVSSTRRSRRPSRPTAPSSSSKRCPRPKPRRTACISISSSKTLRPKHIASSSSEQLGSARNRSPSTASRGSSCTILRATNSASATADRSALTRAFVAVEPPGEVLDVVASACSSLELPGGARRTTRDQWHVTLQFLGNHADVDAVVDALQQLAVSRGSARLGGSGAFPNERRGRVLWLGLRDGRELLQQLAAAVGVLLAPLGHEPEARAFHPHLTLARCKAPADLRPIVAALGSDPVGPAWTASEVVVFESRLRRDGAQYLPRARIPLGEWGPGQL